MHQDLPEIAPPPAKLRTAPEPQAARTDTPGDAPFGAEISLAAALRRVATGYRAILAVTLVCVLMGGLYLAVTPARYESRTTLLPEAQAEGTAGLGLLGQFSGILNATGAGGLLRKGSDLPFDLYPQILSSTPVLQSILSEQVHVPSRGTTVSLATYLDELQPRSLTRTLLSPRSESPATTPAATPADTGIVHLSSAERRLLDELDDLLYADFNVRTGVLSVSVEMADPVVSAQVAKAAVEHLTTYVRDYRLQKLRQTVSFIEQRYTEAQGRFDASLDALARFRDRNQHLARDLARTEEQRLQAEYDLAFSLYNSLATRREEARLQLEEETPVFKVLQPVNVPLEKSYPPTVLTLLLCGVLGLMLGTGLVFLVPDRLFARFLRRRRTLPAGRA